MEACKLYADLAARKGITPSQLALAWCATRWYMGSVIIGATTMAQLKWVTGRAHQMLVCGRAALMWQLAACVCCACRGVRRGGATHTCLPVTTLRLLPMPASLHVLPPACHTHPTPSHPPDAGRTSRRSTSPWTRRPSRRWMTSTSGAGTPTPQTRHSGSVPAAAGSAVLGCAAHAIAASASTQPGKMPAPEHRDCQPVCIATFLAADRPARASSCCCCSTAVAARAGHVRIERSSGACHKKGTSNHSIASNLHTRVRRVGEEQVRSWEELDG
jgi:hypothetical protein